MFSIIIGTTLAKNIGSWWLSSAWYRILKVIQWKLEKMQYRVRKTISGKLKNKYNIEIFN